MNVPVANLSVGQQQRVAVARAIVCKPTIVLADEPTASLDEMNASQAMDLIQQACREAGAALLCASHDRAMQSRFERVIQVDSFVSTKRDHAKSELAHELHFNHMLAQFVWSARMNDISIVVKSLRSRRLSTVITAASVAVATALLLTMLSLRTASFEAFQRGTGTTHLLVSADSSPLTAVLNGVFYANAPSNPISWAKYQEIKTHFRMTGLFQHNKAIHFAAIQWPQLVRNFSPALSQCAASRGNWRRDNFQASHLKFVWDQPRRWAAVCALAKKYFNPWLWHKPRRRARARARRVSIHRGWHFATQRFRA